MLRDSKLLSIVAENDTTIYEKLSDAAMDIGEAIGNLNLFRPVWLMIDAAILITNLVLYTAIH